MSVFGGSDTEPDSDEDLNLPRAPSNSSEPNCKVLNVSEAISALASIDLASITKDRKTHELVSNVSHSLTTFLDGVESKVDSESVTQFSKILQPDFLRLLFDHRKTFHALAAAEATHVSAVVCWVDVVLTKIAECTIAVLSATGCSSENCISDMWRAQRHQDNLRGASQLPTSWDSLSTILVSKSASPAAKRVAVRVLFAICILLPLLTSLTEEIKTIRQGLFEPLRQCILHTVTGSLRANYSSDPIAEQERINFAMLISLFVVATNEKGHTGLEKPHTLSCAVTLLQVVVCPEHAPTTQAILNPPSTLDIAQSIIVYDVDTMFWLWATWNDVRLANTEVVALTTAIWISHVPSEFVTHEGTQLRLTGNAILHVIFHFMSFLIDYPHDTKDCSLLSKCLLAIVDLLQKDILTTTQHVCCREDVCKTLFLLFILLGDSEEEVPLKDTVIESFTLFNAETLRKSATAALDEASANFLDRVKDMFIRCSTGVFAQKTTLTFYVVLRHLGIPAIDEALQESSVYLLRTVSTTIPQTTKSLQSFFVATLFCAVSCGSTDRRLSFPASEKIKFWNIAIQCGPCDLYVATGFAHHILIVDVSPSLKLCRYAWDYLRDVLLLILRGRFAEEQEPLAILVSPVICDALTSLLRKTSYDRFILASPWTATLKMELNGLLVALPHNLGTYGQILQARIRTHARILISFIEGVPETNAGQLVAKSSVKLTGSTLVACRRQGVGIAVVPVPG